jgi:flagellar basal-body rod protein FlgF
MDNPGYVALTRQSGLMREMQTVANNIANMATTGFRREGVVFAEYVAATGGERPEPVHGGRHRAQHLARSGRHLDAPVASSISPSREGFLPRGHARGRALTRAGNFIRNDVGELVTPEGHRLLDAGGAPVFVPPQARAVAVARTARSRSMASR